MGMIMLSNGIQGSENPWSGLETSVFLAAASMTASMEINVFQAVPSGDQIRVALLTSKSEHSAPKPKTSGVFKTEDGAQRE